MNVKYILAYIVGAVFFTFLFYYYENLGGSFFIALIFATLFVAHYYTVGVYPVVYRKGKLVHKKLAIFSVLFAFIVLMFFLWSESPFYKWLESPDRFEWKHFESPIYNVTFDYRADWFVMKGYSNIIISTGYNEGLFEPSEHYSMDLIIKELGSQAIQDKYSEVNLESCEKIFMSGYEGFRCDEGLIIVNMPNNKVLEIIDKTQSESSERLISSIKIK